MSDQPSDWIKDLYARPATTTTPSTEIAPSPKHPARSAAERLRIVEEYDSYPTGAPERGAILRREGIYTSQISKWRKLRTKGALAALSSQTPGPKPPVSQPLQAEVERLRKENARLHARLAQAETIIDVQKKVAALLGTSPSASPVDEP
jgi:transposase